MKPTWVVYMLRCADNSLYTGITTDLEKRIEQHNGKLTGGARYTRGRQPVRLIYQEPASSRSEATLREISIKKMPRLSKEILVSQYE